MEETSFAWVLSPGDEKSDGRPFHDGRRKRQFRFEVEHGLDLELQELGQRPHDLEEEGGIVVIGDLADDAIRTGRWCWVGRVLYDAAMVDADGSGSGGSWRKGEDPAS